MGQAAQKITLPSSRDIPFDKLVLSQSNVRRVKAGVSVEELAEDIARRSLLQGLSVRPVLNADGVETGKFEIPAGGGWFQALSLLVKQERLAKTAHANSNPPGLLAGLFILGHTMADYFTHFSCLLDVGTGENALVAHRMFIQSHLEDADRDEPLCSGFDLSLQEGDASHVLWIHDDASDDVEQVTRFVLRLAETFDIKGLWGFTYALTCSRPSLNAFGGGAHDIDLGSRKSVGWTNTQEWLPGAR